MKGIKWSAYEDSMLREFAGQGFNASEMSRHIGRHSSSIRERASKLGIMLNKRGRHCVRPAGDPSTWNRAQRLCAFANVPLPLAEYVVEVADICGTPVPELRSDSRIGKLVNMRSNIAKEARANGYSFETIGRALNRDHTTIIHAINRERVAA